MRKLLRVMLVTAAGASMAMGAIPTNPPGTRPLSGVPPPVKFPLTVDANGAVIYPTQFAGAYLTTQLSNGAAASNIVAAITHITNGVLSVKDGVNETWYAMNSNAYARLQFTRKLNDFRRLPIRGFNSWPWLNGTNYGQMTQSNILYWVDKLSTNGFVDLGYRYFELEDWYGEMTRNGGGHLQCTTNFTGRSLKTVGDYMRTKGMYLMAWQQGDGGNSGSTGMAQSDWTHYADDAATLASWGVVGGKMDGCNEYRARSWVQAWNNLGIPALWTIGEYTAGAGFNDPGTGHWPQAWVRDVVSATRPISVGSLGGDLANEAMLYQWIDAIADSWKSFGPGFWPELDIIHEFDDLTAVESQMSMACMFSSWLWFSGDPLYDGGTIYTNKTILNDIHWDPVVQCARLAHSNNLCLVFRKDLLQEDGPVKAVALQNRNTVPTNITCWFTNVEMPTIKGVGAVVSVEDLWGPLTGGGNHHILGTGPTTLGVFTNSFTVNVPDKMVLLYRLTALTTNLPISWDTDALAFLGAASITDSTISNAVNGFVTTAKTHTGNWPSGFWASFPCIYPFVGGNSTAHSKNLKGSSFGITWAGTVTHDSTGITGNGTDGWGDTGFNLSSSGTYAQNSGSLLVYCGTTTPTDGGFFIGAADFSPASSAGCFRSSPNYVVEGPNSTVSSTAQSDSDFRGPLGTTRTGSTAWALLTSGGYNGPQSTASTGVPAVTVGILAENKSAGHSVGGFSNANLRFAMVGAGMSSGQYTEVLAAIEAFEAALGRTAP